MRAAVVLLALALTSGAVAGQEFASDVAAARALFEANLAEIAERDRDAYQACYLESERLARTGPAGFSLGYEGLATGAGEGWPEVFEAQDLQLVPVAPGMVYGTYRYRVRFDGVEQTGLSERLFLDTSGGWRIAVSAAFPAPSGTAPPAQRRGARLAERQRIGALNLARLAEAGVPIVMGTDAGNPLTLHGPSVYAELEAMQGAGMAPMDVLIAATANGARALGRQDDLGTVEVLAADPTADVAAFRQLTHLVRAGALRPVGELAARQPD